MALRASIKMLDEAIQVPNRVEAMLWVAQGKGVIYNVQLKDGLHVAGGNTLISHCQITGTTAPPAMSVGDFIPPGWTK